LLLWLLQEPGDQPVWRQLQDWLDAADDTDDEEVVTETNSDAGFHGAFDGDPDFFRSDDGLDDSEEDDYYD
jgi:hypothetical protein